MFIYQNNGQLDLDKQIKDSKKRQSRIYNQQKCNIYDNTEVHLTVFRNSHNYICCNMFSKVLAERLCSCKCDIYIITFTKYLYNRLLLTNILFV